MAIPSSAPVRCEAGSSPGTLAMGSAIRHHPGMADRPVTCWTMIEGAAAGAAPEREAFARRYQAAIRAYLSARWRGGALVEAVDDATQDVFVECFRSALVRAAAGRAGGFRAYLYGIVRNVARRHEQQRARDRTSPAGSAVDVVEDRDPSSLATVFDRGWARAILRQARDRHAGMVGAGPEGLRRIELLRRRVVDGEPIRAIAEAWKADPTELHRAYARARREFKRALLDVVSFHLPGAPRGAVEEETVRLLGILRTPS